MMLKHSALIAAAIVGLAAPALADTLYVAAPPPAAPGHPLRIGADHRATQVGDLLQITFNFNAAANNTGGDAISNSYTTSGGPGAGLFNLPLLRLPTSISANRNSSQNRTQTVVQSFTNSMTAVVTDVLPSGALVIAGDQRIMINGLPESLHVTGSVRPEDLDNTDTVLSSRVANIDAKFTGVGSQEKNRGILQKIIGFFFGG